MFDRGRAVLEAARLAGVCPAAVCEVGRAAGPVWTEAFGRLSYDTETEATTDTAFDLASLTKVIVTTSIVMALVRQQALSVETRVADVLPGWRGADRAGITVGQLLDHSSGLPAQIHLSPSARVREQALPLLCAVSLERPPGTAALYSDVGFMLLGLLLESVGGRQLDVLWRELWNARPGANATNAWLEFAPGASARPLIAPTEFQVDRGGMLQGVVHDENAGVLSGVAGHAGLFGSAPAVGVFAAWVLRSFHESTWLATPELMRQFSARGVLPGSSRALGWDTMLPTSSCGTRMSPTAIGHTGFTGTSLWIDWERDVYVVLLTNRVHPTRENKRFLPYRARFHDAVMSDLTDSSSEVAS